MDLEELNSQLPVLAHGSIEGVYCPGMLVAGINADQQIVLSCNECGSVLLTSRPQLLIDLVSMIPEAEPHVGDRPSLPLASATEFMLDTSALNRLVENLSVNDIETTVRKAGLRLLITHVQKDEVERKADGPKKDTLRAVLNLCEVLPSSGAVYDVSRYGQATYATAFGDEVDRIMIGNPKHAGDALIVNTAAARGCVLVMNDKPTTNRARRVAPTLTVVSFGTFFDELSRRTGG
jgi:predicted nucleic acid-binding protein